jgi:pimeloyl-ACP methyl ester carboxylesterase
MLMTVLDELTIKRCIIIGHSWGSMTSLRAAHKYPARFSALGLFNMPFKRTTGISRISFKFQKLLSIFPKFYAKQAAKALYSQNLMLKRPELLEKLKRNLASRPSKETRNMLDAVILNANDAINLIQSLKVPAFSVVGEEDTSCTAPPEMETLIVPGGHVSPYEAPEEILGVIKNVIKASKN